MQSPYEAGVSRIPNTEALDVRAAVRCALRPRLRGTRGTLAVVALGAVSAASAGPFPAEIELGSLLPQNGGDGSAGFALTGVAANDDAGVDAAGSVARVALILRVSVGANRQSRSRSR